MKVKHREEEIRKQQERECVCSGQEIDEAVNRISGEYSLFKRC